MMSLKNMVQGLENNYPAGLLVQQWEHDAGTLSFWRASSNFVYRFEKAGIRHYLRFIHEEDNAAGNIQAELDFILYLADNGYPAASPVRSRNGRWIETATTASGLYYGVVFEEARGTHIPLDRMSDLHVEAWGKSLASLHRLSETYTPNGAVRQRWSDALDFISSVLRRHPREKGLRSTLEQLRSRLAELPEGAGHTGLIHYDFETDNSFFSAEEGRYWAIDFDDAMVHWFMMDVTSAVSDLLEQDSEEARRKIRLFLTGYRSVKRLDEEYEGLFSAFRTFGDLYMLARLLRSIEDAEIPGLPDWAAALKEKLLRACARIRDRYMPQGNAVSEGDSQ